MSAGYFKFFLVGRIGKNPKRRARQYLWSKSPPFNYANQERGSLALKIEGDRAAERCGKIMHERHCRGSLQKLAPGEAHHFILRKAFDLAFPAQELQVQGHVFLQTHRGKDAMESIGGLPPRL